MDNQICVNCNNEKSINSTTNRLVTESCGHIKCMDCLLHEKNGCIVCLREKKPDLGITTSDNEDRSKKQKPNTTHITVYTDDYGTRTYTCTVCSKSFHARSQVQYHAYCNGQRKPYQCPECDKSFATHSHYKYHMRVHRNERTYACEICGEAFFQMSKLQRHKLKHTQEKKYSCSQCNKGFNNLTSLRKHGLTHTEEKPYSCATCGRRFRDGSNYRKHLAKHTDSGSWGVSRVRAASRRAHQCPRCPQSFHSNKDMRRHSAVHSDSKPFRCKVCDRRFRRKDNLERHIRNTHPNFIPSTAVEFDELAATEQLAAVTVPPLEDTLKEAYQKKQLEINNPLPPLSLEVIEQHMHSDTEYYTAKSEANSVDKSYILKANIARESVIFGPINKKDSIDVKKEESPEYEYVHKIRKANSMASKDVSLPPIDERKVLELERKNHLNNLAVNLPPKNIELLKKILGPDAPVNGMYGDSSYAEMKSFNAGVMSECERSMDSGNADECGAKSHQNNTSPEMHWRRKMKLNINW